MKQADRRVLQQWCIRAADGDRNAMEAAHVMLRPVLVRFCSKRLSNSAAAEDTTQEALIKVFTRIAVDFNPLLDALTWVLTIAEYECRSERNKMNRRREAAPPQETVPDIRASPEEWLARAELERALLEVIEDLSPEDVATLAAAVGKANRPTVKPATFRKRVERALSRLRTAWRAKHGVE